jgi:DNA polymerase-4
VRLEQLEEGAAGGQQLLLDAPERGWRDADQAADQARAKFGGAAIRPATLLGQRGDKPDPTNQRR